jgi:hypothetical protein
VTTDIVTVAFRAHVSGCNSGSPAIVTSTDEVVGVVTHAGCQGSPFGANYATGLGLTTFRTALQALQQGRVAGTTSVFGQGCGAAFGTPALGFGGFPDLGGSVTVQVAGLNPNTSELGILLFGFSDTTWSGGTLPADLGPSGMPGCQLLVRPDVSTPLFSNFGSNSHALAIPNLGAFLAAVLFTQYFAFDVSATTPVPAVTTNGGRITVGN